MDKILASKRKLFERLKSMDDVVGVGIKEKDALEYIVVFLRRKAKDVLSKIPSEFEGYIVKTEVKGEIKAL